MAKNISKFFLIFFFLIFLFFTAFFLLTPEEAYAALAPCRAVPTFGIARTDGTILGNTSTAVECCRLALSRGELWAYYEGDRFFYACNCECRLENYVRKSDWTDLPRDIQGCCDQCGTDFVTATMDPSIPPDLTQCRQCRCSNGAIPSLPSGTASFNLETCCSSCAVYSSRGEPLNVLFNGRNTSCAPRCQCPDGRNVPAESEGDCCTQCGTGGTITFEGRSRSCRCRCFSVEPPRNEIQEGATTLDQCCRACAGKGIAFLDNVPQNCSCTCPDGMAKSADTFEKCCAECGAAAGTNVTYAGETKTCTGAAPAPAPPAAPPAPYVYEVTQPKLEIPIPGFAGFTKVLEPIGEKPNRYLVLPWIGEYIAAIYKYSIGIVGILAGIMIVIGGLIWLTAGGSAEKISTAKSFIESALIGLVIALTSYLLLYAINPKLTEFEALKIKFIERIGEPIASPAASLAEDLPAEALTSGNHSAFITPEQYKLATGKDMPSKDDIIVMMERIASSKGIDKCLLNAIVAKESGYKPNRLGHDEDVARRQVAARRKFINSGKKYSGATFTPSDSLYTQPFPNDDVFDPQRPPNYGLDVRFTHGIGLGQITIIDEDRDGEIDRCPDGNIGRQIGNVCLNALELFDVEKTLEASAYVIKKKLQQYGSVERLFYRYAGGGCSARVSQCKKMKAYAECKGDPNLAKNERSDCMSWLRENNDDCDNKDFR